MKKMISLLTLFTLVSCFESGGEPLPTANFVEIERYLGKWYAVTALPQFFTRSCVAQTAEYAPLNENSITVLNTCIKKKGVTTIKGKAVVANEETNAELIVTFDNFFTRLFKVKGDYTIIEIDPEYRYVLVGSKDRKSLWILSRTPSLPDEVRSEYVDIARKEGFPVENLIDSKF